VSSGCYIEKFSDAQRNKQIFLAGAIMDAGLEKLVICMLRKS
jgi:hypothetical protein